MGRKKCKYCIDFRNMHSAIHGLLMYETRQEAEVAYSKLKKMIYDLDNSVSKGVYSSDEAHDLYSNFIETIFNSANKILNEINFRDIQEFSSKDTYYKYYIEKHIRIINIITIDLYI